MVLFSPVLSYLIHKALNFSYFWQQKLPKMKVEPFASVLCSLFSLGFGVWLFDYVRRRNLPSKTGVHATHTKLCILSATFICIGLILIFVTITSLGADSY